MRPRSPFPTACSTLTAMSGASLHVIFDIAAWLAAGLAAHWLSRVKQIRFPAQSLQLPYIAALVFGAGLGAYLFGTLNLWLSGSSGIARSVEGALVGGIVAVELYKWRPRHHAAHRRAVCAADRGRHRGRASRLLFRRARRFHLWHADRAAVGA